ncbi:hypothetical protein D0436_16675 [Shewanella decolorationis]|uniref:Uncharacterized protein n=1 Tax=Shewanella decolorationis TaxID=256839 RepID=A0A5B8R0W4_9GAMM|nr:hypothetical protein [Shewanella decolorationis]QDZ91958.1 hypothetical protein D0436_16675 [Shewanella decolorationis]
MKAAISSLFVLGIAILLLVFPKTPCACISQSDIANSFFELDLEKANEDILAAKLSKDFKSLHGKELLQNIHIRSRGYCDLRQTQQCQFILKDYFFFSSVLTVEFLLTDDKEKVKSIVVIKT